MNGTTNINAVLNPCSAEMDIHTYGWRGLNVSFWGQRLLRLNAGRLTLDIFWRGRAKMFTSMRGGANGSARYWMWFMPLGMVQWITHRETSEYCKIGWERSGR